MTHRLNTSGPFGDKYPRYELLYNQPSPIEPLENLVKDLADTESKDIASFPKIWIKREDSNSGLAGGGNKIRKLEYVIPDALSKGTTVLVTTGGQQSNHMRQVAAAAARAGLRTYLVPREMYRRDSTADVDLYNNSGNIQLTELMSAERVSTELNVAGVDNAISVTCSRLREEGEIPYIIPSGASKHHLGGLGYAHFAFEVCDQEQQMGIRFDTIFVATNSGSTMAGMIAGFKLLEQRGLREEPIQIIGIDTSAAPEGELEALVLRIARSTAWLIGVQDVDKAITEDDVQIDRRWNAGAYGKLDKVTHQSVQLLATTEGVLLDPVYTGKAFTGMLDAAERAGKDEGFEQGKWLFVHTGGTQAIGVYPTLH